MGISGTQAERGGLDSLLTDLQSGDTIVVWKLDRLGRSLSGLILILENLAERGIGFCSLKDAIDTATPAGRLSFHIMGALAEFERDLISERTKAGMAAAKARGAKIGRPRKLTTEDIKTSRKLMKRGVVIDAIAKRFNVHPRTLGRALARR